jgi:hypothetical protein
VRRCRTVDVSLTRRRGRSREAAVVRSLTSPCTYAKRHTPLSHSTVSSCPYTGVQQARRMSQSAWRERPSLEAHRWRRCPCHPPRAQSRQTTGGDVTCLSKGMPPSQVVTYDVISSLVFIESGWGWSWEVTWRVPAKRGHARHHTQTSPRLPSHVVHIGSCCPYQRSRPRAHGGQATARVGRVGEQHEQRSEQIGCGQIANEKWITARQSASMRERQRLYLQHRPYGPRRRTTAVSSNFLRQTVTREFYKPLCTTHHTALHPHVSFSPPVPFML